MESPKSVKYSLACTFIATILMIPYCEEIYKDDFDYTDWKHVLRLSPFVFVPILSIFTFIGVAQKHDCSVSVGKAGFVFTLPIIFAIFVLGIQTSTTGICSQYESLCLEKSETCSKDIDNWYKSLMYVLGTVMMITGYACGIQGLFKHQYRHNIGSVKHYGKNDSPVKDKTHIDIRMDTNRGLNQSHCLFNQSPEQSFTGSGGKDSVEPYIPPGPPRAQRTQPNNARNQRNVPRPMSPPEPEKLTPPQLHAKAPQQEPVRNRRNVDPFVQDLSVPIQSSRPIQYNQAAPVARQQPRNINQISNY